MVKLKTCGCLGLLVFFLIPADWSFGQNPRPSPPPVPGGQAPSETPTQTNQGSPAQTEESKKNRDLELLNSGYPVGNGPPISQQNMATPPASSPPVLPPVPTPVPPDAQGVTQTPENSNPNAPPAIGVQANPPPAGISVLNQMNSPHEKVQSEKDKSPQTESVALEKEALIKIREIKKLKRVYAILETNLGTIKIRLFNQWTPRTVYNFVGLAEGTRPFRESSSHKMKSAPFYDGLIFHRVIPGYMIQTGDPLGTGRGGPGYKFDDEPHPSLKHNKPGRVSMANYGPNTNGSQFFITLRPIPDLDFSNARNIFKKRGNTVFGEVVKGMDVVKKISEVPRDNFDKPFEDVVLKHVTIVRIARKAKRHK